MHSTDPQSMRNDTLDHPAWAVGNTWMQGSNTRQDSNSASLGCLVWKESETDGRNFYRASFCSRFWGWGPPPSTHHMNSCSFKLALLRTRTCFFASFRHSDEETAQILPILGGEFCLETGGEKYKGFWGAKHPKIQKCSRAKRAKTKENKDFLLYILAENLLISGYIPGSKYRVCL